MVKPRPKALFVLDATSLEIIYGPEQRRELEKLADFYAPAQTCESLARDNSILAETEVIFSGWGAPVMDEAFLKAAPKLRAVFYGAGSIRGFTTEAFWERGIVVTSAYAANAVPVSEYSLATILLSLKHFWRFSRLTREGAGWGYSDRVMPGAFRSTVGLISLGMIARKLITLLKPFDIHVIAFDPFVGAEDAKKLNIELCSLDDIFRRADVVSLHAPNLPQTRGMITGQHFSQMKEGATFINSARGAVVREPEMIEVLQKRADLTAILDVTDPEPPAPGSPLLTLPNVILTPHIAGSMHTECQRMGHYMVEEFRRYLAGEPLVWGISRELSAKLA